MPMKTKDLVRILLDEGFVERSRKHAPHRKFKKGKYTVPIRRSKKEYDDIMLKEVEKQSGLRLRGR